MDELQQFQAAQEGAPADAANVEGTQKPKRGRKGKKNEEGGETTPKAPKEPKVRRDNIAFIGGLNSLAGVRKALQIAIAKKAKSVGKEEAIKRYEAEIEAAKAKLDELVATANAAENLVAKLIELDEEPNKIITHFIKAKEDAIAKYEEANAKMPKSLLKETPNDIPTSFLEELGIDLAEAVKTRFDKKDYRLHAVCRAYNFMAAVEAGTFVLENGKFKKPGQPEAAPAGAEPTTEVAPATEVATEA